MVDKKVSCSYLKLLTIRKFSSVFHSNAQRRAHMADEISCKHYLLSLLVAPFFFIKITLNGYRG